MCRWDWDVFNEKLGNTVEYGVVVGNWYTGKTTVTKMMADNFGYEVVDMKAIAAQIKSTMGTEDEPFEGEVP